MLNLGTMEIWVLLQRFELRLLDRVFRQTEKRMVIPLALALERSVYWIVKNSLRRPRPQEAVPGFRSLITASDQFSFPSGHSSGAFLLATAMLLVYGAAAVPVYLWGSGVALSRILLGVHFPGDTLAGAIMGTGLTLLAASLLGMP